MHDGYQDTLAEHPGVTQMHAAIHHTHYWPQTALDVTPIVRDCLHFAKKLGLGAQAIYLPEIICVV